MAEVTEYIVGDGGAHVAAGSSLKPMMASNRSLRVAQAQGRFHDAVMRGRVFSGCTAVGGVAPGTTVSTTAAFSLYNPVGSGYNLVVLRASMGYVSGTIGAGVIFFTANTSPVAAATTGTAITPVNCLLGGASAVGKPLTTATIPAPTLALPAWSLNKIVLDTTAINAEQNVIDVDGAFIVTPGCTLSLQGLTAAGSSPLVVLGMTWEEVANT